MSEERVELVKLNDYPYIKKYFGKFLSESTNNLQSLIHHLTLKTEFSDKFEGILKRLSKYPSLEIAIRKSVKNDFFDTYAEIDIADYFNNLGFSVEFIKEGNGKQPDIKATKDAEIRFIEVKRLRSTEEAEAEIGQFLRNWESRYIVKIMLDNYATRHQGKKVCEMLSQFNPTGTNFETDSRTNLPRTIINLGFAEITLWDTGVVQNSTPYMFTSKEPYSTDDEVNDKKVSQKLKDKLKDIILKATEQLRPCLNKGKLVIAIVSEIWMMDKDDFKEFLEGESITHARVDEKGKVIVGKTERLDNGVLSHSSTNIIDYFLFKNRGNYTLFLAKDEEADEGRRYN